MVKEDPRPDVPRLVVVQDWFSVLLDRVPLN
jgi:hypothetical protein